MQTSTFGVVFIVFDMLAARMVRTDIKNYRGVITNKNFWLIAHLQRMVGAYAAALTAFLVVNNNTILPPVVAWLLPTAILLPLIIKWTRQYTAQNKMGA